MDELVVSYHPKIIVYYCGSNDVNAGESAAAIFGRVKQFVTHAHAALPGVQIYVVSINPSVVAHRPTTRCTGFGHSAVAERCSRSARCQAG